MVDDLSTDDTLAKLIAKAETDERVKLIRHQENSGAAASRNSALEAAQGDWIAFCDSDDLWLPNKLELQLKHMAERREYVNCSAYYTMSWAGERNGTIRPPAHVSYSKMLYSNKIGNLTGIYSCKEFGKVPFEQIGHEDYLMWLQVVKRAGDFSTLQMPLASYRLSAQSLSGNKLQAATWVWNIHKNKLDLGYVYAAWLFLCYVVNSLLKRVLARIRN